MPNLAAGIWDRFARLSRYLHGKGFFHLLTGNFLGQFLGMATILIVAKLVSKDDFGYLRVAQGYLQFLIPLASFGVNIAVLRFCAEDRPEAERAGILSFGIRRLLIWSALVSACFCALALSGGLSPHARLAAWAAVMVWMVPLQNLSDACNAYLQALKRFVQSAKYQTFVRAQSLVLVVAATWVWGVQGFVYGLLFASAAVLVPIGYAVGSRNLWARPVRVEGFVKTSVQAMAANSLAVAMVYADAWLLDHTISDPRVVADYQWGAIFSLAAIQINATAQNIAAPYFSERSEDEGWLWKRMLAVQRKLALGSVPIAALVFGGVWVLAATLFPDYRGALPYAAVLLGRYVVLASMAIVQMGLLSKGRHGWNVGASALGLGVGLSAGWWLAEPFGALGIAWGQVIGAGAMAAATWLGVRRVFRGGAGAGGK